MVKSLKWLFLSACVSSWLWAGGSETLVRSPLLVLGPENGRGFNEVLEVIQEELAFAFEIHIKPVDRTTDLQTFETYFEEVNPSLMVLLDNAAAELYRLFQQKYGTRRNYPPTIVTMALFVDEIIAGMENVVGLNYEVAAVTSLSYLRDIIESPVRRIGVLYRAKSKSFLVRQQTYCRKEQIELVGFELADGSDRELVKSMKKGLKYLTRQDGIDGIWIINDSVLLGEKKIHQVWLPHLRRYHKPVVVGVNTLAKAPLGNFAVFPDHFGIGNKIVDLAIEIMEREWELPARRVLEPTSVHKLLNAAFARKYLGLKEEKLEEIDILIDNL